MLSVTGRVGSSVSVRRAGKEGNTTEEVLPWPLLSAGAVAAVAAVAAVVAAVMAMMAASAVAREPTAADVATYPPCGWLPSRVTSEAGAVPLDSTRGTPHL